MLKTFIIAEAGINHNGNLNVAMELINSAKECGADAIKFQTYKTKNIVTKMRKKQIIKNTILVLLSPIMKC